MVKFYLILFNYRDLHLIDARTGEFIRLGCLYYARDAPAAERNDAACCGPLRASAPRPAAAGHRLAMGAPRANRPRFQRGTFAGVLRHCAKSLTHRRRDLLYLAQQYLDLGADIGQDMTEFTLGIG
jgi:hypothetical protein